VERILVRKEHPALLGGSSSLVVGQRLPIRGAMQVDKHGVCCVQFGAVVRKATVGHRTVLEWVQPEQETDVATDFRLASNYTVATYSKIKWLTSYVLPAGS
jgi:hypothetical protein